MHSLSKLSLLILLSVYLALLLPAITLLPSRMFIALGAVIGPTFPIFDASLFNMWIFIPMLVALGLFLAGRGLVCL